MSHQNLTPKIYVACLAAYNQGKLHGIWIEAALDLDDIHDQIEGMLANSPVPDAEEYAVHASEGFGGLYIGEHDDLDHVHELAVFIEDHGELGAKLIDHLGDLAEAEQHIADAYHGGWSSLDDYAADLIDNLYDVPEGLQLYIDYVKFARDLALGGDIFTIETSDGQVHVFQNR